MLQFKFVGNSTLWAYLCNLWDLEDNEELQFVYRKGKPCSIPAVYISTLCFGFSLQIFSPFDYALRGLPDFKNILQEWLSHPIPDRQETDSKSLFALRRSHL
jgi:hypothetical protein